MKKENIKNAFERLNDICKLKNIKGEIGVVGGAAMVLAYGANRATKDVDAIFEPANLIRKAAEMVSEELGLPSDWLNDAVKGFLPKNQPQQFEVLELSNLVVWVPEPEYMLAMKCISARFDSKDSDDIIKLCKILKLKRSNEVLEIIQNYYPKNQIPPKTSFFIDEIFEN